MICCLIGVRLVWLQIDDSVVQVLSVDGDVVSLFMRLGMKLYFDLIECKEDLVLVGVLVLLKIVNLVMCFVFFCVCKWIICLNEVFIGVWV